LLQEIPVERLSLMTSDGRVYDEREERYDGKHDYFFNEEGSHDYPHGHVVESRDSTPDQKKYDYARDVDRNIYIDNRSQHQRGGGGDMS
jgi:hypothetical protein